MTHYTKSVVFILIFAALCSCTAKAQSSPAKSVPSSTKSAAVTTPQIPEEFWDYRLDFFALGYLLNNNSPLKTSPTPRILFKQMKFYSEKLLDGTEKKSSLVKTEIKGNDIIFTIKTLLPPNEIFIDLAINCDMQKKEAYISSYTAYSPQLGSESTVYFKKFLPGADQIEYAKCQIFYENILNFISIWYGWDEFNKYLQ